MKKIYILASAVFAGFLLLADGGCSSAPRSAPMRPRRETVNELRVGEQVEIRLPGNPTTGYDWTFAPSEKKLIAKASATFEAPAAPELCGAPGTAVYRFEAAAAGTLSVRAVYARSWEKNTAPAESVEFRFVIGNTK